MSPAEQVPPLQHPPLHAVVPAPHALPHWFVDLLHAWPALLPLAAGQSVAELHPQAPLTQLEPAPFPEHVAHVPDVPHAAGLLAPLTHALPEQQKPPLHVPLPAAPHADVHAPPMQVGVPAPHTAHARPLVPHAPLPLPATHVPALQHPSPQGCDASQPAAMMHAPLMHVMGSGQSLSLVQPHTPVVRHACPTVLSVQSTQNVPSPPQAVGSVPGWHNPFVDAEQHPIVHVCDALQANPPWSTGASTEVSVPGLSWLASAEPPDPSLRVSPPTSGEETVASDRLPPPSSGAGGTSCTPTIASQADVDTTSSAVTTPKMRVDAPTVSPR